MKMIRLFCFPYAGGSAGVYIKWKKYLGDFIELYPIELAGRGKRFKDPVYSSMDVAVMDTYNLIREDLDNRPYSFFGHSMGTVFVCEMMKKVYENKHTMPVHLFLSGRYPPHITYNKIFHKMPYDEFVNKIFRLGGTPDEVLKNRELMDIVVPIIRSDYRILETHKYQQDKESWNVDISVFNGRNDHSVIADDINKWGNYTNRKCEIHNFEGGHFFIHDKVKEITQIINSELSTYAI